MRVGSPSEFPTLAPARIDVRHRGVDRSESGRRSARSHELPTSRVARADIDRICGAGWRLGREHGTDSTDPLEGALIVGGITGLIGALIGYGASGGG